MNSTVEDIKEMPTKNEHIIIIPANQETENTFMINELIIIL